MQQLPSNYRQTDWGKHDFRPKLTLRRLHEEPIDAVGRIAGDIGPRRATSLAEAQAAAYLDGRLRRAGMRVSPDTFSAPATVGWDGVILATFAFIGTALYYWFPLPSLALALWVLALACWRITRPKAPLLAPRRDSQNIIGTRAVSGNPRWRVVVLAPLDSPLLKGRVLRRLTEGWRPLVGRLIACGALVVFAGLGLIDPRAIWWYAQFLPLAYLLLMAVIDGLLMRASASPGAVSHAGAVAVLLSSAESLVNVEHVELWTVGIGASSSGAGLLDLLRRYPFERQNTLFVSLEGLGSGRLVYITREGRLREQSADALLLRLVAAADAADPLVDVEPRPYLGGSTMASVLHRDGWRALTIMCLDADGTVPLQGTPQDTLEAADGEVLNRAARLVTGLVQQIDQSDGR